MKIQIARNGAVLGEFSREEIDAKISQGVFDPTDQFWKEGMVEWKPLQNLDFYVPRTAAPVQPPAASVQRTDLGEHRKKTSGLKQAGSLMMVVGVIVAAFQANIDSKGVPIMGILGGLLLMLGFFVFVAGRMQE